MANRNDAAWYDMYEEAKLYVSEHGDLKIPVTYVTKSGKKLGFWIKNQKKLCDPESERGKKLIEIGMTFEKRTRNVIPWEEMYKAAEEYFREHDNLEIPVSYVTSDGKKLGIWIQTQRRCCNPESERGKKLLKIGMRFEKRLRSVVSWEEMCAAAETYLAEHGNLNVPVSYVTSDGKKLGKWLNTKKYYCDPESEYGKFLIKLGLSFESKTSEDAYFRERLDLLEAYFKEYGVGGVPSNFKTNDGITYDENGINLGMWLAKQVERCNPESEHGKLLYEKGVRFNKKNKVKFSWNEAYNVLKSYCEKYGSLDIPYDFVTIDGVTYDENGLGLKRWLCDQIKKCDPDSAHGILLKSIVDGNIVCGTNEINWLKMYKRAVEFYKEHGHLDVSMCSSDSNEVSLARWLAVQKSNYRKNCLSEERVSMLEAICIIWDVSDNRLNLVILCEQYNIDVYKNKDVLKHMPYYVFESKIDFLIKNGISIVDENGKLCKMFFESNIDDNEKNYCKKKGISFLK